MVSKFSLLLSCFCFFRFLHPGVTDKGNYSMFEVTRPMVAPPNGLGHYPPEPRGYAHARVCEIDVNGSVIV